MHTHPTLAIILVIGNVGVQAKVQFCAKVIVLINPLSVGYRLAIAKSLKVLAKLNGVIGINVLKLLTT